MVGQASEPANWTDTNANSGRFDHYQQVDDNGNTPQNQEDQNHAHENQDEDICSCSLAKDTNIKTISSSFNNNGGNNNIGKGVMSGKNSFTTASTSPYILSLSTSRQHSNHHVLSSPSRHPSTAGNALVGMGSPKRKRRSKKSTPPSAILPPLDIQQQTLHHHLTRRSAAARKAARVHTVPAMVLSGASPKSTGIKHQSTHHSSTTASTRPRPHSANQPINSRGQPNSQHGQEALMSYPSAHVGKNSSSAVLLSPIHHRRARHHGAHLKNSSTSNTPERHYYHSHHRKLLCTPEKMARRREVNKIETVRILRARPAFYPIKEKPTIDTDKQSGHHRSNLAAKLTDSKGFSNMTANSNNNDSAGNFTDHLFDLQGHSNSVLGKHITLRMDRAGDLKRKRRHNLVLPPTVNLQQR